MVLTKTLLLKRYYRRQGICSVSYCPATLSTETLRSLEANNPHLLVMRTMISRAARLLYQAHWHHQNPPMTSTLTATTITNKMPMITIIIIMIIIIINHHSHRRRRHHHHNHQQHRKRFTESNSATCGLCGHTATGKPIFIQCQYWEEVRPLYMGFPDRNPVLDKKSCTHGSRNAIQY